MFWTWSAIYNLLTKDVRGLRTIYRIALTICGLISMAIICTLLIWCNTEEKTKIINLPFSFSNCDLVLEQLEAYSGLDIENKTDLYLDDVAAGIFINDGNELIESAHVEVFLNSIKYDFQISMLAPGMRILVLNSQKHLYISDSVIRCNVSASTCDVPTNLFVVLKEHNKGYSLTNRGYEPISVSLYYRVRDENKELYYGGVATKLCLEYLPPGKQWIIEVGEDVPPKIKPVIVT